MTIYIHFLGNEPTKRLFNVDLVSDAGPKAVKVKLQFGETNDTTYENVSHVALQPSTDEG